jgi:cyclic beta-1,2-glucan synthetase
VRLWEELLETLPTHIRLIDIPAACQAGLTILSQLNIRLEATGVTGQGRSARSWCESLACKLDIASQASLECCQTLLDIRDRSERLFKEMDFGFLFAERRKLFPIGFDVDQGKIDSSFYDLLASEARLASLAAIAKGDVPHSHWLYLGRPMTRVEKGQALLSWNGSLFEYLLPGILVRYYPGTLLYQAAHAAIASHIHFGRQRGIPWGISESGDYQLNLDLSYRYRPYGIQDLSLRQMLSEELVITPYASLLALSLQPQAVVDNLAHLCSLGMLGPYGFYEAVDFTTAHLPAGQIHGIVKAYMSHHQGMILLAITNYLCKGTMVNRFHCDPRVESVELTLQE